MLLISYLAWVKLLYLRLAFVYLIRGTPVCISGYLHAMLHILITVLYVNTCLVRFKVSSPTLMPFPSSPGRRKTAYNITVRQLSLIGLDYCCSMLSLLLSLSLSAMKCETSTFHSYVKCMSQHRRHDTVRPGC